LTVLADDSVIWVAIIQKFAHIRRGPGCKWGLNPLPQSPPWLCSYLSHALHMRLRRHPAWEIIDFNLHNSTNSCCSFIDL